VNTTTRTETKTRKRSLSREQHADTLRPYFADVGRHDLFTPDQETEQAEAIEETELACWRTLLGQPSTVDWVIEQLSELSGDDLPDTAALRAAMARSGRGRRKAIAAEADRVAQGLRELSNHWDLLEALIDRVRALPGDARASSRVRFRPHSKRFGRWLQQIEADERAAARARNTFVSANLRLVFHTARKFSRSGVPFADLIQEGNLGLLRAIDKFDHRRGIKFSTYSGWWIRHMISRAVANGARAVRIPVYLLELRGRIDRSASELERELGRPPTDAEIAEALDVPVRKIDETRAHCRSIELSLDDTAGKDEDGSQLYEIFSPPANENGDAFDMVAAAADQSVLAELLDALPARERDVIEKRFGMQGREWTLQEIADQHDLSRERIRQIEKATLADMREAFARRERAA
jgi:RNA polymerase sigma factor (sigma-70 family)